MPRLTPEAKRQSLERLIDRVVAGDEVSKRDINALLTKELQAEFENSWKQQQALRKVKKPAVLNQYEILHKQALMIFGRYDSYAVSAKVISNVLVDRKAKKDELANKAKLAIKNAQDYLIIALKKRADLAVWMDRDIKSVDLGLQYDLLPFLITSRSEDKLIDIKERFNWKTIKEVRLEVLKKALVLVDKEIDNWYEANGYVREDKLTEEQHKIRADKLKGLLADLKRRR
ncbi:hypothetical protein [Polynucleobacter asymbioticus]|jgi:hypothetical protein|uniref:Uncharacterized protein n=1 Tax=Polynucleobacter asymbioticus TaxID=576611 RepID=A0AAC9IX59_9BURK|nr:hypothetical protein [Polynucleobacter asymbioticus]APB98504.1 hypothetical protein A4F89_03655 [Polynucleobacter asymbioticus]APC00788.1 hypothetical protein AOC25_03655 [Polynucleobacter asymbioticus]QWD27178.1 hypothetical protein G6684_02305 [Polynucleobacter paneuropaeus]